MTSGCAAAETATIIRVVALLIASLFFDSSALAQPLVMSGALELPPNYRPTVWQPVRLDLRNESNAAIDGVALLPLATGNAPATMKLPVSVPPHSIVRLRIAGYFPRLDLVSKKKQADVPPLSIAEFRAGDGALLSRAPIMGLPLSAKGGAQGEEENGQIILMVNSSA